MPNSGGNNNNDQIPSIFRSVPKWQNLRFYQKSVVLYQMTYSFCMRFLPKYGDRTVDQMVQAARAGKQNIVEGSEDGKTSTAMELNFLQSRKLPRWTTADQRFQPMQDFTKKHNQLADYEPYFQQWTAEEMANVALTLCYQIDTMINKYLKKVEEIFVKEGGVKERMHKARTEYRKQQDERLAVLESRVPQLEQQLSAAQAEAAHWKAAYDDLKQRALKAYNQQQEEIKALKQRLGLL